MADRIHPNVEVRNLGPNWSSRNGHHPVLIVIHDTEGRNLPHSAADLRGLGNFFDSPEVQASAHVATDGDGNSIRLVLDRNKAWHCAAFNSVSLGIEQIGFASQGTWSEAEIHETARWVARWCKMYGIPLRKGKVRGYSVVRTGIVRHSELGAPGGGHHDPGPRYPMRKMLAYARHYRRLI